MRLPCWFLLVALVASAGHAATLSPADLHTVLRNAGLLRPNAPPIWHLTQSGDGKAYSPGGIAWFVEAFGPPHPLAADICVVDVEIIKADKQLHVFIMESRRRVALRPCRGLVPDNFQWLHSFDDRGVVHAIEAVRAIARTGSVARFSVQFVGAETRTLAEQSEKDRLYSIVEMPSNEMVVTFSLTNCGQLLAFTVNEEKHSVKVALDRQADIVDNRGHMVPPPCRN